MSTGGPLESDTCRDFVVPRLHAAGWTPERIVEQYPVTDGRIVPGRRRHRREPRLRADYLLHSDTLLPLAVVEAKRAYKKPGDGLQQAMRYAVRLDLPLAYSSNGKGIVEHDFDTGRETKLSGFPSPDEVLARYKAWKGIVGEPAERTLFAPFTRALHNPDGTVKEPRSYQRVAIQRALEAIVAGKNRALLTMATGTGKTFVAMQIVWKLWSTDWPDGRKPRILYLADRNVLVDQPIAREFRPVFGEAIHKLQGGEATTSREIYFALYQALADSGDALGMFSDYPADYFDLVIVDECHRGSASEESSWRAILEHFAPASQLGMTATPKRDDNVDTYKYFGAPLFTYSLREGIEDGFLAPYRVRRVVLSPDAFGWSPDQGQLDLFGKEIPPDLYTTPHFERVVSLLSRTELAARHLSEYLNRTDRMAKTIVFCVNQEHADQMRFALNNANADLAKQYPDYVARIVSDEGDVGKEHLGNFADPERLTPVIATTSMLLSTGVDLPTVRNIVLFKPIGSIVEFKQIIGRGTRLYPDDDKLSFEIIDYSGATALFEDPGFDGDPESIVEEEVDDAGEVVEEQVVQEPEVEYGSEAQEVQEEELEAAGATKYYVDEVPVWLVAEGFYLPDPSGDRLRLVSYDDYLADAVRRLFIDPAALGTRWSQEDGRAEVVVELEARGVSLEEMTERTGLIDADPFDILVHVAWNRPLVSRRDRVRRVLKERSEFMDAFRPEAREILEALLEKYAAYGPGELDLRVLEVPPIDAFGTPVEIADRFGGADALREAVDRLQGTLYAA